MSKTSKKIIISLFAICLVVSVFLGLFFNNRTIIDKNNVSNIENKLNVQDMGQKAVQGFNGNYVSRKPVEGEFEINDNSTLQKFLKGNTTEKIGILTKDFALDWGGTSSDVALPADKILDGNGHKLTIKNVKEWNYKYYRARNDEHSGGEEILPELTDVTAWGVQQKQELPPAKQSYDWVKYKLALCGGLVTYNRGTIKNVNFIWDSTSILTTEQQNSDFSVSMGFITGLNLGTIDNCSMTIANDYNMKMHFTYFEEGKERYYFIYWEVVRHWVELSSMRNSILAFGGFAGTNMGVISNSKIALGGNISIYADGGKLAFVRLYIGGIAGIGNGGSILNVTATGAPNPANSSEYIDGDLIADCNLVPKGSNSRVAIAGIICGTIAIADKMDPDNENPYWATISGTSRNLGDRGSGKHSLTPCFSQPGIIDGVMVYWKGYASLKHGIDNEKFSKEPEYRDSSSGTLKIVGTNAGGAATIKTQGLVCGFAGNYNQGSTTLLDLNHIYYVNYDRDMYDDKGKPIYTDSTNQVIKTERAMPNITVARYWGASNEYYRGNLVDATSPSEPSNYLAIGFDKNHKLDIMYGTLERKVNEQTVNNEIVWNVNVSKNDGAESVASFNPYLEVKSLSNPGVGQNWELSKYKFNELINEYGLPSEAADSNNKYENASYKFNVEFGEIVTIKPKFVAGALEKENLEPSANNGNSGTKIINYEDKVFNGEIVVTPTIELFADDKQLAPLGVTINDEKLFVYNNNISQNMTPEKNFVGDWELKFANRGDRLFIIDSASNNVNNKNYIAFRADHGMKNNEDFIFTRTVTQKEITCTIGDIDHAIEGSYKNQKFNIIGDIPAGNLIDPYNKVSVDLEYFNDGVQEAEVKNAGNYVIKAKGLLPTLDNSRDYVNYKLASNVKPGAFNVSKAVIKIENDPEGESISDAAFTYTGLQTDIRLSDKYDNTADQSFEGQADYDANAFYIKHSSIFGLSSDVIFNVTKFAEKPANAEKGSKKTNEQLTNVGWFSYTLTLVDKKNFDLVKTVQGVDTVINNIKYYFEIKPALITFEAEGLSFPYTGAYPVLKVDSEDPANDDIKIPDKPEHGSKVYIATQFMPKDQNAGITKPGIQSGVYVLRIYLDTINSINYKTAKEYIEIDNVEIAKQVIEIKVTPDAITDFKSAHQIVDEGITYTGKTVAFDSEQITATTDPSITPKDLGDVEYKKVYEKREGEKWVAIDRAPKDIGEYKVYLTLRDIGVNNVLNSYDITKAFLFQFKINQKAVTIEFDASKPIVIQYGDNITDERFKFTGQSELASTDDLVVTFTENNQQLNAILEPGIHKISISDITGKDSGNYKFTYGNRIATIEVQPRDVYADFNFQGLELPTAAFTGKDFTISATVNYGKQWVLDKICKIVLTRVDENGAAGISTSKTVRNVGKYIYKVELDSSEIGLSKYFNIVQTPNIVVPELLKGLPVGIFEITPMEVNIDTITNKNEITYGDAVEISNKITNEAAFDVNDEITIKYIYYLNGELTKVYENLNKPGKYSIGVQVSGGRDNIEGINYIDNYNIIVGSMDEITVNKKDIKMVISEQKFAYDDDPTKLQNLFEVSELTPFINNDYIEGNLVLKTTYTKGLNAGENYTITLDLSEKSTMANKDSYNFIVTDYLGQVGKKNVEVKLSLPDDLTYTGEDLAKDKAISVVYSNNNPFDLDYTLAFNDAAVAIDAKDYVASITLTTDTNHNVTFVPDSDKFTILPKDITWNIVYTEPGNKKYGVEKVTYDTTEVIAEPNDVNLDSILPRDKENIQFEYYVPFGTEETPGDILIDVVQIRLLGTASNNTAANNYNIITKTKGKALVAKNLLVVSIDENSNNKAYDGNQHLPKINGVDNTHIDIYVRAYNTEEEWGAVTPESLKDAGKYQIKVVIKSLPEYDGLYEIKEAIIESEFNILPKEIVVNTISKKDIEVLYGDELVGDLFDNADFKSQLVEKDQAIELTAVAKYQAGVTGVKDNAVVEYSLPEGIQNYVLSNPTNSIIVKQREVVVNSITLADNLVYDGTQKTPTVLFDYANIKPEQYEIIYMLGDVATDGINAGKYVINVTIKDKDNLVLGKCVNTVEMEITKLAINPTFKANTNLVYNGEIQEGVNITFDVENVIKPEDYIITYTKDNKEVENIQDAGKYIATFKFKDTISQNLEIVEMPQPVEVDVAKLVITVTMTGKEGLIYTGAPQDLVDVTFSTPIKPSQYTILYKKGLETVEPINAGRYMATFVLVDKENIELSDIVKKAGIEVAKLETVLDVEGLTIEGHYNRIVVNGIKEGQEYTMNGGITWVRDGIFESGVNANTSYEISVRMYTDQNHIGTPMEKIGEYKTGADPTKVNGVLDTLSRKFTYSDIAKLAKAEELLVGVNAEDMSIVNMAKLEKARKDKKTLIDDANDVVKDAQIVGAKAGGKSYTGAVAAAATALSVSLAGIAIAIAKKKMFF